MARWLEVRERYGDDHGAGWWRWPLTIAVSLAALWLGGFMHFVAGLPDGVEDAASETDAIVVLTGGADRLDAGFELLLAGKARKLLVTGVAPETTADALQARGDGDRETFECCVELGHEARDTAGNARETAMWVQRDGYRGLRVVTANYHMPRALLLFRRAMPDVRLVANPVFPAHVKTDRWWFYTGTARLLTTEFTKYLISLIRIRLSWGDGGP